MFEVLRYVVADGFCILAIHHKHPADAKFRPVNGSKKKNSKCNRRRIYKRCPVSHRVLPSWSNLVTLRRRGEWPGPTSFSGRASVRRQPQRLCSAPSGPFERSAGRFHHQFPANGRALELLGASRPLSPKRRLPSHQRVQAAVHYASTWLSLSAALPEVSLAMTPSAIAVMKRLTGKCAVKFNASSHFSPPPSAAYPTGVVGPEPAHHSSVQETGCPAKKNSHERRVRSYLQETCPSEVAQAAASFPSSPSPPPLPHLQAPHPPHPMEPSQTPSPPHRPSAIPPSSPLAKAVKIPARGTRAATIQHRLRAVSLAPTPRNRLSRDAAWLPLQGTCVPGLQG